MTRDDLHDKIANEIEKRFSQSTRNDGSSRPILTPQDCKEIANIVYSTIGSSGLGIYDHASDLVKK